MNPPARICRAIVQDIIGRPVLTGRQRDREDKILIAGEKLMARFGRHGITFALVAASVSISRATLFFHFTDLDALLGEILRRHLRALATALGEVPRETPNRQPVLRATYLHATRGPFGGTPVLTRPIARSIPSSARISSSGSNSVSSTSAAFKNSGCAV